jgi:SAM-dependent methyltransferase
MWYKELFEGKLGEYWLSMFYRREEPTQKQVTFLKNVLKEGMVLDHCCGPGRLSIPLSLERKVIGIDLSKLLLKKAKERARKIDAKNVFLVRADMRSLPFKADLFENVLNFWTSFGYFSDKENEKVLQEIVQVMKANGLFIIDIANPDWILRNFKDKDWHDEEGFYLMQERTLNWEGRRMSVHWVFVDKKDREIREIAFDLRLYSIEELRRLFKKLGLKIIKEFGSFTDEKFDKASSKRIIIVGLKT